MQQSWFAAINQQQLGQRERALQHRGPGLGPSRSFTATSLPGQHGNPCGPADRGARAGAAPAWRAHHRRRAATAAACRSRLAAQLPPSSGTETERATHIIATSCDLESRKQVIAACILPQAHRRHRRPPSPPAAPAMLASQSAACPGRRRRRRHTRAGRWRACTSQVSIASAVIPAALSGARAPTQQWLQRQRELVPPALLTLRCSLPAHPTIPRQAPPRCTACWASCCSWRACCRSSCRTRWAGDQAKQHRAGMHCKPPRTDELPL